MKVLFLIRHAAFNIVINELKRLNGVELGIHVDISKTIFRPDNHNLMCTSATIKDGKIKKAILNKKFKLKGIEKIYVEY